MALEMFISRTLKNLSQEKRVNLVKVMLALWQDKL